MHQQPTGKILLVDDDKNLLVTLGDHLTFEGFEVTNAPDAETALEHVGKETPDLVILDICMPGIGGLGFIERLRNGSGRLPVPVLVLSARTHMQPLLDGTGIEAFVPKPCPAYLLTQRIRDILSRQDDPESSSPAGKRLLLAEDHAETAKRMTRCFESEGFAVTVASSGPEVLDLAVNVNPDVIALKEVFTGMNGSVLTSLLRAMPSTRTLPVILYDPATTTSSFEENPTAKQADRVILSDDPKVLARAIREVLFP